MFRDDPLEKLFIKYNDVWKYIFFIYFNLSIYASSNYTTLFNNNKLSSSWSLSILDITSFILYLSGVHITVKINPITDTIAHITNVSVGEYTNNGLNAKLPIIAPTFPAAAENPWAVDFSLVGYIAAGIK